MTAWELGLLARAAGATNRGGALPESVGAVGTDTRSLPPQALFVALRGERFDGHDFVDQALDNGASVVLIDQEGASKLEARGDADRVPHLVVKDTLQALGDIARAIRDLHDKPVAAVTGSNGKTTTKELMAAALSVGGTVHKTHGNFNNLIGVPLTLFAWPEDAWVGVVEMGMNATGEIARLAEIARPNVGLITNVGVAHLEGLGSVEAIARAKGELYAGLAEDSIAVVNLDDPMVQSISRPLLEGQRQITFGTTEEADVRILSTETTESGMSVTIDCAGTKQVAALPLSGMHNALNAAAAIAVGMALELPVAPMVEAMSAVNVPGGRFRVLEEESRGIRVVDDTYNANPPSMKVAFATLADLAEAAGDDGRRVAVIGDMLELGERAGELHQDVGRAAAQSGVRWVLSAGAFANDVAAGAKDGGAEAQGFDDVESLISVLGEGLLRGDWVLVKGSRGARMERVVRALIPEEGA